MTDPGLLNEARLQAEIAALETQVKALSTRTWTFNEVDYVTPVAVKSGGLISSTELRRAEQSVGREIIRQGQNTMATERFLRKAVGLSRGRLAQILDQPPTYVDELAMVEADPDKVCPPPLFYFLAYCHQVPVHVAVAKLGRWTRGSTVFAPRDLPGVIEVAY